MKNLVLTVLTVVSMFVFASCSSNNETSAQTKSPRAKAQTESVATTAGSSGVTLNPSETGPGSSISPNLPGYTYSEMFGNMSPDKAQRFIDDTFEFSVDNSGQYYFGKVADGLKFNQKLLYSNTKPNPYNPSTGETGLVYKCGGKYYLLKIMANRKSIALKWAKKNLGEPDN